MNLRPWPEIACLALLLACVLAKAGEPPCTHVEAPPPAAVPALDLVFTSSETGVNQLYLWRATGETTQLTHSQGGNNYAVWSPDGTRIAFQSMRDGKFDVWVMAADGSDQRRLTDHQAHDYLPSWSPDGQQIAFLSRRKAVGEEQEEGHYYLMNADGSQQRRYRTEASEVSEALLWNPEGGHIATTRNVAGGTDFHRQQPDGTVSWRLVGDSRYNGSPSLSLDGTRLAFYSLGEEVATLEWVDLRDGRRRVVVDEGRNWYPHWSPDGDWLVFTRSGAPDDSVLKVWVTCAEGEAQTLLIDRPGRQFEASWRPGPPPEGRP